MRNHQRSLLAYLAFLALLLPAPAQACALTAHGFGCRNGQALATEMALAFQPYLELYLGSYKKHLLAQSEGKMKTLPLYLTNILSPYYPEVDLAQIRYAEEINTIHGKAIAIGKNIYLPAKINFANLRDLHWMLHELEHVAQYAREGGESKFIAQYLKDVLQTSTVKLSAGSLDAASIHDEIQFEQQAKNKADAIIKDVFAALEAHQGLPRAAPR